VIELRSRGTLDTGALLKMTDLKVRRYDQLPLVRLILPICRQKWDMGMERRPGLWFGRSIALFLVLFGRVNMYCTLRNAKFF
jgi:hypothetical protein